MAAQLEQHELFPLEKGAEIKGAGTLVQITSISEQMFGGFREAQIRATVLDLPAGDGHLGRAITRSKLGISSEIVLRGHPCSSVFESDDFAGLSFSLRRDEQSAVIRPLLELSALGGSKD